MIPKAATVDNRLMDVSSVSVPRYRLAPADGCLLELAIVLSTQERQNKR